MVGGRRVGHASKVGSAAAVVLLLGCGHDAPRAAAQGSAASAAPGSAVPNLPAAVQTAIAARPAIFGRPIDATATTSLVDIAKAPASYRGKVIATEGTVTRVCQERGCWMAIRDETGTATVRMHGHSFFVPTTSGGKHARVQGTVVLMKDGRECDEAEAVDAKLELDATGVELM
jgi:hypothetical protein